MLRWVFRSLSCLAQMPPPHFVLSVPLFIHDPLVYMVIFSSGITVPLGGGLPFRWEVANFGQVYHDSEAVC